MLLGQHSTTTSRYAADYPYIYRRRGTADEGRKSSPSGESEDVSKSPFYQGSVVPHR